MTKPSITYSDGQPVSWTITDEQGNNVGSGSAPNKEEAEKQAEAFAEAYEQSQKDAKGKSDPLGDPSQRASVGSLSGDVGKTETDAKRVAQESDNKQSRK